MEPPLPSDGTCSCKCLCCGPASPRSADWRCSLTRKLDGVHEDGQLQLQIHDATHAGCDGIHSTDVSARVEIENEAPLLRETLSSQQQSIQDLYDELDEERSASASAASEAMSMILRLQREKAEVQMEFRQFKRFAEERMSHDQEEIAALEDLLFKRDQAVQALACELQAYRHRLMSFGFGSTLSEPQTPDTGTAMSAAAAAAAAFDYPQLRCKIPIGADNDDAGTDVDKYAFGETPKEQIQNLEHRIFQMESMPSSSHDKGVVAFSPRMPMHARRLSTDSFGEFPVAVDRRSERDDSSDRVYTVDAVHCRADSYMSTPREFGRYDNRKGFGGGTEGGDENDEIKRLYARMQALEADRETMRHTIMSMGTDKAQLVLLKEIAQQLCKEAKPQVHKQKKVAVKKPPFIRNFSIFAAVKWITSLVLWKRKSLRTRYPFGLTSNNSGLLLLLDKSPWTRQRRCLTRAQR